MAMIVLFVLAAGGVLGAESACTQQELNTLMACVNSNSNQFNTTLGTGGTCDRTKITSELCSSFTKIVTCANTAAVSDTTCRPSSISQVNGQLEISCKIEDFQAICTTAPRINTGIACTQQELNTLMACVNPYTSQFTPALGTGGTCERTKITSELCSSFTKIVTCTNAAAVSDTTCRPSSISQVNGQLVSPCKIEDFQTTCTSSPKINTGNNGGSIHGGWTMVIVVAVAHFMVVLSSTSLG